MSNSSSVELWLSYIDEGNSVPPGETSTDMALGWTKDQASARACRFIPCTRERFIKIVLCDYPVTSQGPTLADEFYYENILWHDFGYHLELKPDKSAVERDALIHLHNKRYASAWLAMYPEPPKPAQADGESKKPDVPYLVHAELRAAALAYLSAQSCCLENVPATRANLLRLLVPECLA